MFLQKLVVGQLSANCYIIAFDKGKEAAVIDPGEEAQQVLEVLKLKFFKLKYILLTHAHVDHIGGVNELVRATKAKVCLHPQDLELLRSPTGNLSYFVGQRIDVVSPDVELQDGQILKVDGLELEVLHTPGHTQGSVCFLSEDNLFTGDLLFKNSVGRTDLIGSSYQGLVNSLKEKVVKLPDETKIFPGHGPQSILAEEKVNNPYLKGLV